MSDYMPSRPFILLAALSTFLLVSACEPEVERELPVTSPAVGEAASVSAEEDLEGVFTTAIRHVRAKWEESNAKLDTERGWDLSQGEERIIALNVKVDGDQQPAAREVRERVSDAVGVQLHPGRWICESDEEIRTSIGVDVEWVSDAEAKVNVVAATSFPGGRQAGTVYPFVLQKAGEGWLVGHPPRGTFPRGQVTVGGEC